MSLKDDVLAQAGNGSEATFKQTGLMSKLTGLKWWEPQSLPKPTTKQASLIIGAMMDWQKDKTLFNSGWEIVSAIQIWFPNFNNPSDIHFRGGKKKAANGEHEAEQEHEAEAKPTPKTTPKTEAKPTPKPTPKPEAKPTPKPEPKPEPKPKKAASDMPAKGEAIDTLRMLIKSGQKNIWLVGPAGCGKTTICKVIAEELGIDATLIPCGAGTSATTFGGFKFPERESTAFVGAYSQDGIIILDEFTALESQVAQIANSALANDELAATTGNFQRHENCIIIATSNTFGNGADRMYVANNQLDASTKDRFVGGFVRVDYSKDYEKQYDNEVAEYVWNLRTIIDRNGLRQVASTRMIQAGCRLKAVGMKNWKQALIEDWPEDAKNLL